MAQRVGLECSLAVSEAVKLANADVIAAYPITPQTHIVEHLSELVASGELDAEFVPVESEHSAMSACVGSSAAGARTFTSSSSQGLALMHEILYIASALRLPIVMVVANRALSGPISIWNDHGDIMSERDINWVQFFAENGQEVLDLTITAFKIAEDHRVTLPVIVNMDGFILTHVIEPIEMPEQNEVDAYLPPFVPAQKLDPAKPISMGMVGVPEVYTEARKACVDALEKSYPFIVEHWNDFAAQFGRHYKPIECYKTDDAEALFVTMGSLSETAMTTVDELRAAGQKVGLVHIRLWRPFPTDDFLAAIGESKPLMVLDRALSPGCNAGPVATELRALLYAKGKTHYVANFVAGLGGRDVTRADFKSMMAKTLSAAKSGAPMPYEMVGVKE
ncbi:pyruvate flavodoxin/ferredoxin oxidoreductase domain protein [Desulfarculus baarsii DSM 2075]|uniref:Pyruvate flavodoxin/ferredoxin oxidoreductase domain protein n=1 Tax=Desulfarculus baarsii (strain ATCC 33931 / DSM 2075 / LMG 7858 / VKM B-1802 / 2st14) TaxID=644282 RepID=E1QLX0_DESB2|nr:2-ketoisovalerate ferredoxin oxidoreductase subunit alpha [Desulfarculus baarsii]ADK86555.1 pyruvate flavodoxin/ferredoxin oxidoreductase domain protein [Desulfarculus baarsii DSM 2075]